MDTQTDTANPNNEPGRFTIPGQPLATRMLGQVLDSGRLSRAYLFLGPAGTGKRVAAECFAHVILGGDIHRIQERIHPDLVWIEPTVKVGKNLVPYSEVAAKGDANPAKAVVRIEQIRAIQTRSRLQPLEADRTVVVIEADRLQESSANALLKVVEESGPTLFILIATQRPLATITSRCQVIPFHPVSLTEHQRILSAECPAANHPLLVKLTLGRPTETIKAYRALQPLCETLKPLLNTATSATSLMEAASQISALPITTQTWLLRIAQWQYATEQPAVLEQVQTALQALQSYVSPLLVWDVFLGYGAIPILPDLQAEEIPDTAGVAGDEWGETWAAEGSNNEQLSLAIAPPQSIRKQQSGQQRAVGQSTQKTRTKETSATRPQTGETVIPLFG